VYEALVDDATLHEVIANGEAGTLMPGFGQSVGGSLTDAQVDALVHGMRAKWAKGDVLAGENAPPYKATQGGDAERGQQVYVTACSRCHGATAQQPGKGGSILDGSFLALVNAQMIRTTLIAGRPDVGQPDWREDVPGHPLTDGDIHDVTAWLLSQRPANPGQPYPNNNTMSEKPGEGQPTASVKE
jgi:cytochrome c oxidase cbb3-type subunit 3/ubiquinol-cytochrome c reductase cytochrome c subunit